MNVNVRSIVQLTQMAIPHLVKTKGTIVNVSSVTGTNAFPGVTYYCMSKAAIDQFTKCLALELASTGVRVNAVNPGVIVTQVHKRGGLSDEAYAAFLEKGKTTHALGRVGEAHEVAKGIYYLASEMSSFTTGHLLAIDGGRGIMTPR
uniref:3-oxoacyl-[acyl-carrier-protein] reductase FabG n=1 Tax=Steinernema glaseri TaxID=37863 RepID=A0A1I8A3L2_9BILA